MIRTALAVVSAVLGLLLLGFALQVRGWQRNLRDDDLRFQVAPLTAGLWTGPGGPGAGAARSVLGVGDDVRFRHAESLFVHVQVRSATYSDETERLAEFGEAQSSLQALAKDDPSPARRARASNLLGVLLWEDAQSAGENTPLLLRESLGAFRNAIRDDARNADAKYNLELLSTLVRPSSQRGLGAQQEGSAGGVRGAGLGKGGRGY
jgi:hypothetical protein